MHTRNGERCIVDCSTQRLFQHVAFNSKRSSARMSFLVRRAGRRLLVRRVGRQLSTWRDGKTMFKRVGKLSLARRVGRRLLATRDLRGILLLTRVYASLRLCAEPLEYGNVIHHATKPTRLYPPA